MSKDLKNPYYRSLEEREPTAAFRSDCAKEFKERLPFGPEAPDQAWTRRDFLKAMGFGTAAVMAVSCSQMPVEKAIPYLIAPEAIIPGKSTWYSSTCGACPAQCSIMVKTREGRPIKIEGNPEAALNRGGLCAVGQSGVLDLYDSGRLHGPLVDGHPATWSTLDHRVAKVLGEIGENNARIRFLTSTMTSPTWKDLLRRFQQKFPKARLVTYDAVSASGLLDAHEVAFGKRVLPHYHFERADLIVSLGADFLGSWISPVEFSKQYRQGRVPTKGRAMSRHVQFESRLSLTGSNADERHLMKPSEELPLVLAILNGITGKTFGGSTLAANRFLNLSQLLADLKSNQGKSLVVSGSNDQNIQLAILAINEALGNYGATLDLSRPSQQKQGSDGELESLRMELEKGLVDILIIHNCNPVYDTPDGAALAKMLKHVKLVISLSGRLDETAVNAHLVAPDHHYLETWNDSEPIAGLFHFTQPLIGAVYSTRHAAESLMTWMGEGKAFETAMKDYWGQKMPIFSNFWQQALHNGFYEEKSVASFPRMSGKVFNLLARAESKFSENADTLELEVFESVMLRDGRNANNPWLQETPDPLTKVTWGNVVQMSVADGKRLGISLGQVVRLEAKGASLELPVVLQPGQMSGTVSVALGYGRTHAGKVGNKVGQNAFPLVTFHHGERSYSQNVRFVKTSRTEALALTQIHYSLEGRPLVRDATLTETNQANYAASEKPDLVMLWQQHESKDHAWGLAIDLSACTGCSGCLVGCQAENNVPVVGKDEVQRQREMHWIRIDRYYKGDLENPDVVFEPMLCQHCGNAPCESVCPVLATIHSSDGLNQQVYNRCVGTRYCANNCPYKVRRFNWFDYANNQHFDFYMNDAVGKLVLNPDVTVRSRGVMEKCSLCVQRIQEEKINAKASGKRLDPDAIKTACQQSCPTDAIVFGDRNDPESKLSKIIMKNPRAFHVLEELNVKPAITYLAKVRNRG